MVRIFTLSLLCSISLACASTPANLTSSEGTLDRFNRSNRGFNFWILDHVLEPMGRGYNLIMPKWGQARIRGVVDNLQRPRDTINSALQLKWKRAGNHLGSFVINSTVGLAGMFNISERFLTVESPETTGETFGHYGVPAGNYLILPLYGETSPRSLLGAVGDAVMNPVFWIPGSTGVIAGASVRGAESFSLLAGQMPKACASESEWEAYEERLEERTSYPESKELYFENLRFDVED